MSQWYGGATISGRIVQGHDLKAAPG
jgi:hypothetical protein